jgi:hypothetical protein
MSERANQLFETADGQLRELIGILGARDGDALRLPCPGREKMGDGTVAACAAHTADRYQRIAEFLASAGEPAGPAASPTTGGHRLSRVLRARDHRPREHAESVHEQGTHEGEYTAESVDLESLLERLRDARNALAVLAELTDEQLDTVPPADSFRFCDGQRTLEQVVASLVTHQSHQVDAVKDALT